MYHTDLIMVEISNKEFIKHESIYCIWRFSVTIETYIFLFWHAPNKYLSQKRHNLEGENREKLFVSISN